MEMTSNNPPVPFARLFCWVIVVALVAFLPAWLTSRTSLRDPLLKPSPHAELEALLSIDPELAIPEAQRAVEEHDGLSLRVAWLQANCAEVRMMALKYFLQNETEFPSLFIAPVETIAREKDRRIQEINTVESSLGRHRHQ
jgi:hypothetical protein